MLDLDRLVADLAASCEDAGVAPGSVAAFVVDAQRPEGTTPMAYLQPAGFVWPDTVLVFRCVGVEQVARHYLRAHRFALWSDAPGIPEVALAPMLRHELEHARRWERSGTQFFEADDLLRAAVQAAGGDGYSELPSEQEANAAAAVFAGHTLTAAELDEVRGCADCAALLTGVPPPADVVAATLGELARREDWIGHPGADERLAYIEAVRAACSSWDASAARSLVSSGTEPLIEVVAPAI